VRHAYTSRLVIIAGALMVAACVVFALARG
jgi:hypothetical protein